MNLALPGDEFLRQGKASTNALSSMPEGLRDSEEVSRRKGCKKEMGAMRSETKGHPVLWGLTDPSRDLCFHINT